jgi:hypothetical protein
MTEDQVERVARLFHEAYEELAPQFSYTTRKASAVPWADVPENNKRLMIATVRRLFDRAVGDEDWSPAAAMLTLNLVDHPPAVRSEQGVGIEHASWMLGEIIAGRVEGRKAHRWLGYAQAILVEASWLTLDEAKAANKEASDAARPLPRAPDVTEKEKGE